MGETTRLVDVVDLEDVREGDFALVKLPIMQVDRNRDCLLPVAVDAEYVVGGVVSWVGRSNIAGYQRREFKAGEMARLKGAKPYRYRIIHVDGNWAWIRPEFAAAGDQLVPVVSLERADG